MTERDKLAELKTEIKDIALALRTCGARVFDMNATLTDLIAEANNKRRDTDDLVLTVAKTLYGARLDFENLPPVQMAPFLSSAKRVLRVIGYME